MDSPDSTTTEDAQLAADLDKAAELVAAYQRRLVGRTPHIPVTFCVPADLEERSTYAKPNV